MKRTLVFLTLSVLLSLTGHAQTDEFVKLSHIVSVEGYSADLLFHNASNYLDTSEKVKKKKKKKNEPLLVKTIENSSVTVPRDITVYSGHIAKHPLGHLHFEYKVEVKDEKYRYTFSDMNFIPYSRNRYGRFEANTGKSTSLQSIIDNPKYRFRKEILKFIGEYTTEESARLQSKMLQIERAEIDTKPTQEDW